MARKAKELSALEVGRMKTSGGTLGTCLQWPVHRDARRSSAHLDPNVWRGSRHSWLRQLQRQKFRAGVATHRATIAATAITRSAILAQPPVHHVGVQPATQRYRGNGCATLVAGLKHLGSKLSAVLSARHPLALLCPPVCIVDTMLTNSWTGLKMTSLAAHPASAGAFGFT